MIFCRKFPQSVLCLGTQVIKITNTASALCTSLIWPGSQPHDALGLHTVPFCLTSFRLLAPSSWSPPTVAATALDLVTAFKVRGSGNGDSKPHVFSHACKATLLPPQPWWDLCLVSITSMSVSVTK